MRDLIEGNKNADSLGSATGTQSTSRIDERRPDYTGEPSSPPRLSRQL
jgi:hypothetical protein